MSIVDNIKNGIYDTKLSWPEYSSLNAYEKRVAYRADEKRLVTNFRADLASEYNLTNHPKEPKLFQLAWEHGHSAGLEEVANYYDEFAELIS